MNVIALSRIALRHVLIRFKYTILAYLYAQAENVIMQLCKLVFHIPLSPLELQPPHSSLTHLFSYLAAI